VEKTALQVDGVKTAKVDQRKGEAVITYDPAKATPESIARMITKKTGFAAEVPPRK
jgi:copper chaperone CopZ